MVRITPRDELVLLMMTKLRVAELLQIATLLFAGSIRAADKSLDRLVDADLLGCLVLRAKFIRYEGWLHASPEHGEPNFGRIEYRLRKRNRDARRERLQVYHATPNAVSLFGGWGTSEYPYVKTITHDLLTADYFIHADHRTRETWRGEHVLAEDAGCDDKLPDATCEEGGRIVAIESANRYRKPQLEAKHTFFLTCEMPYRLI